MTRARRWLGTFGAAAAITMGCSAEAKIACAASATLPEGSYDADQALVVDGSLAVTCTRSASDPQGVTIYIGITQASTGREMTRQGGSDTLPYALYRSRPDLGLWTDGPGVADGGQASGGLLLAVDFMSPGALVAQRVVPLVVNIPARINRHVGAYEDVAVPVSVRLGSADGEVVGSGAFAVRARIVDRCRITPPAGPLLLRYTAFMPTAALGSVNFDVHCTIGTAYSVALDPASATIDSIAIRYELTLDAPGGQGTAAPQVFRITGSAPANQAGRCGTGTVCSASRRHGIVVTY